MTCYDFPDLVVHEPGCPYTQGKVCHPRPSSEAPREIVESYMAAVAYRLRGVQPGGGLMQKIPKSGGHSVDPHTGERTQ